MKNLNLNKKVFSKIGTNYLIYLILTIIFQIILINVVMSFDAVLADNINVHSLISMISNYILPFPILILLMSKLESRKIEKHSLDIKTLVTFIAITFTLMWIGNIIGLAVTYLLGSAMQTSIPNPVQELINTQDIWLNLAFISLVGPIFEEILFRKILIDRTIRYGAKVSIIMSAVLFGFFHANLNQIFYAMLMGGFFGYVYIRTGKVTYTILLHIVVNFMGSVASLFVVESAAALTQGAYVPTDLGIIAAYMIFIFTMFLIGILGLSKFRKSQISETRPEIELENPYRTMFLNLGMICFIGFCTLLTIYQIL